MYSKNIQTIVTAKEMNPFIDQIDLDYDLSFHAPARLQDCGSLEKTKLVTLKTNVN